jgi:hypothetical protein
VFVSFLSGDIAPVTALSDSDQAGPVERVVFNILDGPVKFLQLLFPRIDLLGPVYYLVFIAIH